MQEFLFKQNLVKFQNGMTEINDATNMSLSE